MPALEAFSRKWDIGSDDLVFPGLASLLSRVLWILWLVGGLTYYRKPLACPLQESRCLAAFISTMIAFSLVIVVLDATIVFFSGRGSVTRTRPRRPVAHLLHCRVACYFLEVLLQVIGTMFVFFYHRNDLQLDLCPHLDAAYLLARIVSVVNWCILITLLVSAVVYLDPCHFCRPNVSFDAIETSLQAQDTSSEVVMHNWQLTQSVWKKRFRLFYLGNGEDRHKLACSDLAEIFANVFCDTNVVFSDVITGFTLLQKEHIVKQLNRMRCNRDQAADGAKRVPLNFKIKEEREAFENALHFHRYALGIYSWVLYIIMNPWCCCCRVCALLSYCHSTTAQTAGDNMCCCHLAGLSKLTGVAEEDLIYVSFKNDLYESPFLVCLDHSKKAVVVAIRGTLTTHDVMTDLNAHPVPIGLPHSAGILVHKGMFHTAKWVFDMLQRENLLDKAFGRCPDYKLVVAGHSLGAGCACILSFLLRPHYPSLHCYCISPSGAVVNEVAARYTENFTTSVTLGDDFIARLNVRTAHLLKEDVVRVLERSRKPKFQIIMEGGLETLCTCYGFPLVFNDSDHCRDKEEARHEVGAGNRRQIASLEVTPVIRNGLSYKNIDNAENPPEHFYMPGKIIHITETRGDDSACVEHRLEASWAHRSAFDRITVSPYILLHHLPNVILGAMKTVFNQNRHEQI